MEGIMPKLHLCLFTVYYEDIFNFSSYVSGDPFSFSILRWKEANLGISCTKPSILARPKH